MTTLITYTAAIKDGLLHFKDRFCTVSYAAKQIGANTTKIQKLANNKMLLWDQPINRKTKIIEVNSLGRLKHPELEPDFSPLIVKSSKGLQRAMDNARHSIAYEANLPPCAVKIYFDVGRAGEETD